MLTGPAIVKNSQQIAQPRNEWPAPIRGDAPIDPDPHRAAVPPRVDAGTTAANHRNPVPGVDITVSPTPFGAGVSPNVAAEFDKMGPEVAGRVRSFIQRKA